MKGFSYPVAYEGMCFPASCSLEDIETNSILLGTAIDTYEMDKKLSLGYEIVAAFSLKENLKYIFDVPVAGGLGRVDFLDGMRSLREMFTFLHSDILAEIGSFQFE